MNSRFRIVRMRKITYAFLGLIIIGLAIILSLTIGSSEKNIAYAETQSSFIHYSGTSHNFKASVYFPSKVE